ARATTASTATVSWTRRARSSRPGTRSSPTPAAAPPASSCLGGLAEEPIRAGIRVDLVVGNLSQRRLGRVAMVPVVKSRPQPLGRDRPDLRLRTGEARRPGGSGGTRVATALQRGDQLGDPLTGRGGRHEDLGPLRA